MYAVDLKENKLVGSVNISGKSVQSDNSENDRQSTDTGFPTWAKILISVVSVIVFIIILIGLWFYFRYKKYVNSNDKSKLKMQEVWAASGAEASGNSREAALNLGNRNITDGKTPTIFNDEAMVGYGFFQHDVELEDMEKTKIPTKDLS
ncbi:hypothetical protein CONCODRAFT_10953 [Conidiobolus coronatus NRRL 28638]|uniref:Uncharacterized protein n=1 Tax=Conidiobolus coronatus (strain ATCC 28846 / CBS 209.66 / NRRL 28638) TaxID=796925 RepID=A0A137NWP7_CONC2|nr:hypothetical protein CONCODRAFT_10953 [Conidiobolus coronatus NRRL 28638]|eukprot:KXN67059.1 hypothetical protein CONCODRAFT_10953 [Conidiobolus coronatus NRRL 28638]